MISPAHAPTLAAFTERRFLVIASSLSLLATLACQPRKQETPAPVSVKAYNVQAQSVGPIEVRGTVAPDARLKLGFKMPGVVASIRVDDGQTVKAGELLATLDDSDAKAMLRVAQAGRDKALRDVQRATRLVQEGALPQSQAEDAQSALEAAEASLSQAQDALSRTRLLAPFAGTVAQRLAEPGETVGSGNPVLLLDSTEELLVRAGLTEQERSRVNMGRSLKLKIEQSGQEIQGQIRSLSSSPNPMDGLYPVDVRPVSAKGLVPGMLVRLELPTQSQDKVLRIPLDAIVRRQDVDHVAVLHSGRVSLRPVQLGRAEGRLVEVRSGLKEGEHIVQEGGSFLQDGQSVRELP